MILVKEDLIRWIKHKVITRRPVVQTTGTMKRTLNLTSLLVNAMALIAPGAFLWTTFQVQAAQTNGGVTTAGEMWTGLLAALILAFLTAISYAELANIYPKAGSGSTYYYAEASFLEKEKAGHRKWARIAKFLVGWISHLYYWIYPGIMVAFSAILIVYIFGLFGITLAVWQQILVAILFAVLNGYIAYRGITGSTMTAIVINAIQLAALIAFAILAILYRHAHPELAYVQTASSILIPHNFTNLLFQSTIAILLLVGFESVTSLGSEALQPKKDIKRAILLSLVIQGAFAYLFEYFAAIYFVGPQLTGTDSTGAAVSGWGAAAASGAPIGDMVRIIGDQMLRWYRVYPGDYICCYGSAGTDWDDPCLPEHRRPHHLCHGQGQRDAHPAGHSAWKIRHPALWNLDSRGGICSTRRVWGTECG